MERLMAMDTAKEAALLEQVLDQAKDFLNSRGERFVAPRHPRLKRGWAPKGRWISSGRYMRTTCWPAAAPGILALSSAA